jgi:hypothetical protein
MGMHKEQNMQCYPQCLTKHHNMEMYGGMEVQFHAFLTLALECNEWDGVTEQE